MFKRIFSLLLAVLLPLSLMACGAAPQQTNPVETEATTAPTTLPTEPEVDAGALYQEARKPFDEAAQLQLEIETEKRVTVGLETYTQKSRQTVQYRNLGTEEVQVLMKETLTQGESEDRFEECYADGMVYLTVVDSFYFKGEAEWEEYLARFAPAVLLDEGLYESIILEENTVLFADPTGPEDWAVPAGAEFVTASGRAELSQSGKLEATGYEVTYRLGSTLVTMTVRVAPSVPDSLSIAVPETDSRYVEVEDVEAIRLYDIALMHLFDSESVATVSTETIVSQAAACILSQQAQVSFHGTGADHVAQVTQNITQMVEGQSDSYSLTERYKKGSYTAEENGTASESTLLSAQDMFNYVQEYLAENAVALDYFRDAELEEVNGLSYLELDFTDEYGQFLNQYISSTLFQEENFLDDLASTYETTDCTGYMAIDRNTGFPTAVGITYSGNHTIDGIQYALSLQADQSFQLASLTAYESATGEPLPEEQPETAATPLLYHVTGEAGQEMWLFGTIHVGDARTGYLPEELYGALDSADALAVEFDTQAFEEALEDDQALAGQIAKLYFYADGTATKDHLQEDTYEDAVMLLKASGNYNANAEMMKPCLWAQSLENFYLQQGYCLVSEKGADNRLLTRAKEKGLEILDIESGLFQMEMMTGFSGELQEVLLEEALSCTAAEYCAEVQELYELWCSGDEAALRELLNAQEEGDAQYQALVEEYNKAMSYDRNEGMLTAAVDYLESGKVIFYAVGLAHLLDNTNGLVDALQDAGYTVELVNYA